MARMLSKEYVAMALIKVKYEFFRERFITMSELNQFDWFIQEEFNKQNLEVVITSNNLSRENFIVISDVVMPTEACYVFLEDVPIPARNILTDKSLIANFFIGLETERLKALENAQVEVSKGHQRKKQYQTIDS